MAGDRVVVRAGVSDQALDVAAHAAEVQDARCGAVVTFTGVVRDHAPDADGPVSSLDYSHHPSAPEVMQRIAQEVLDRHPEATVANVSITHRVGHLPVGGIAVVAAVATPHRREAFEICEDLIETVKHQLPVWKRQETESGTSNWVGIS